MIRFLLIALFLFSTFIGWATPLVLEGNYQGKNLYVQNPFAGSGVGFCISKVTVNGNVTSDQVQSSAFEIDFGSFDLAVGDPVVVRIEHKGDCKPKVLNPEVLKPKSTFETAEINVTDDGKLIWKTTNETGQLPYIIQQKRWNKWINIGEVQGKGTPGEHKYEYKLDDVHSGENEFRVIQEDYTGGKRISRKSATYRNPSKTECEFNPKKVKDKIMFTCKTRFEIFDAYGNMVKRGYGEEVIVENLEKGVYYLNFDNSMDKFFKK